MRSSTRLLAILFVLILSGVAMAIAADATRTGDEYLEHIYVALNGELTVYDNPELTKFGNSVETDEILIIDGFQQNEDYDKVAHISEPEHLAGYVDTEELIEVMAVWSDTLNIREEVGLSARKLRTARRGEAVFFADPSTYFDYHSPPEVDGYYWRKCLIGDTSGWVADDFLIEKSYFDALEPALEFYDAGELKSMRTYLEELDRNYADIDCEIASDGRSAIVAFEGVGWYTSTTVRVYLVGEADKMVYSDDIFDYFISDGGKFTFVYHYPLFYGVGYCTEHPYIVFNNQTGEEVLSGHVYGASFSHLRDLPEENRTELHLVEFVEDSHLLVIRHAAYDEPDPYYPSLVLIDITTGGSIVLLEPGEEWLKAHSGMDGVGKLRRSDSCSSPSPIIEAAMKTDLFHLCEERLISGIVNEG